LNQKKYVDAMATTLRVHNLETLIRHHLLYSGYAGLVKRSPYVMYTVRAENGTTRWALGVWSEDYKYYIKYPPEYNRSEMYKHKYEEMNAAADGKLDIDSFYKEILPTIMED